MKKISLLFIFIICLLTTSCESKNRVEIPKFTCTLNDYGFYNCGGIFTDYNKHGDLVQVGEEKYAYTYNKKGLVETIKFNDTAVTIKYTSNDLPSKISFKGTYKTILSDKNGEPYEFTYTDDSTHTFTYKDGKLESITKSYYADNELFNDYITFEYYDEGGIKYVRETTTYEHEEYIRVFKESDIIVPSNALELINVIPNAYYESNSYLPDTNYFNASDSLVMVKALKEYIVVNYMGYESITEFYFDKNNRYIGNSNKDELHSYEDEDDNIVRYTILKETNDEGETSYYEYKVKYYYEENVLVKFDVFERESIKETIFNKLSKKYLKNAN